MKETRTHCLSLSTRILFGQGIFGGEENKFIPTSLRKTKTYAEAQQASKTDNPRARSRGAGSQEF